MNQVCWRLPNGKLNLAHARLFCRGLIKKREHDLSSSWSRLPWTTAAITCQLFIIEPAILGPDFTLLLSLPLARTNTPRNPCTWHFKASRKGETGRQKERPLPRTSQRVPVGQLSVRGQVGGCTRTAQRRTSSPGASEGDKWRVNRKRWGKASVSERTTAGLT